MVLCYILEWFYKNHIFLCNILNSSKTPLKIKSSQMLYWIRSLDLVDQKINSRAFDERFLFLLLFLYIVPIEVSKYNENRIKSTWPYYMYISAVHFWPQHELKTYNQAIYHYSGSDFHFNGWINYPLSPTCCIFNHQ